MKRIVILGAGFVGLPLARQLACAGRKDVEIILIDRKSSFVFLPWLIDAIAGEKGFDAVQCDLSSLAQRFGFRFVRGTVTNVDREQQRVFLVHDQDSSLVPIDYDYLVLCPGSETNYYGVPGAEELSFQLKHVDDVEMIHRRAQECIRSAMDAPDEEAAKRALAFVGVGGGAAGIEAFAGLQRYVTEQLRVIAPELSNYPSFTLVQGGPQILPGFHPLTVKGGMRSLEKLGIRVNLNDPVAHVSTNFVLTKTGQRFDASLVLWCGGIRPAQVTITPDIHREPNGCLLTDATLRFSESIFAAGDVINYRQGNVLIPKNAQTALRMATCLGTNILRTIDQQPLKRFNYLTLGTLIVVGNDGYLELPYGTIPSRFVKAFREFFYKHRFKQIAG